MKLKLKLVKVKFGAVVGVEVGGGVLKLSWCCSYNVEVVVLVWSKPILVAVEVGGGGGVC